MDENTFVKLCLGAATGGAIIFSGYLVHRFALKTFPKDTPIFADFEELRRHLTESSSSKTKDNRVAVEGSVEKQDQNVLWSEKAGAQGAARQIFTVYGQKKPKTKLNMNISVPFKLVGINGTSVKIVNIHEAHRVVYVMQKVWEETPRGRDAPFSREYMLTYGTRLGVYGVAELSDRNNVVFKPFEVDTSPEDLIHHRNVNKLIIELGSVGLLGLGIFVWALTFISVSQ